MAKYYSTIEAAKILKITRQGVIQRIWRKRMEAIKVGGRYIIPAKELKKEVQDD